jgi:thioredoxin-like negative regulator of GroEL
MRDSSQSDPYLISQLVRRQGLQLAVLIGIVIAAFFATRALAANNRTMTLHDAAEWYRRGQDELAAGHVARAADDFRRATVRDRMKPQYTLALAHALALDGDTEAARNALVALRNAAPEDRDVNLELARLAAATGDITAALRYYHNALYAPWPFDADETRRRVRLELIRLLIAANANDRAQSELFILSSDLPNDTAHHIEAARLFTDTGDHVHALEQYRRALQLDADNIDALVGAGQAAFQLGDYRLTQSYLQKVSKDRTDIRPTSELVDLLLGSDPWAPRIGSAERRRRLVADFADVEQRLEECATARAGTSSPVDPGLLVDARTFDQQLQSQPVVEQETLESAFDLIDRIERDALRACSPPSTLDKALAIIASQHGGASK